MDTVEVTTVQALLGFPDLRAAVVAGWHRGVVVPEVVISTEVAVIRDAITEALPLPLVDRSQRIIAFKQHVEHHRSCNDQDRRGDEAGLAAEAGIRRVLPVETGDRGRHRHDGGPDWSPSW